MPTFSLIERGKILEPEHPVRATMDDKALTELSDSIRAVGLIEPLIVRAAGDKYEVIAGHRRLRACAMIQLREVPCLVCSDTEAPLEATRLHENLFREDLTAAEEGWWFCELIEKYKMDETAVVNLVRHNKEYVFSRIELVKTDAVLAQMVAERLIGFGVARELLRIEDDQIRHYYARMAVAAGCSIRQARTWVENYKASGAAPAPAPAVAAPDSPAPPPANPMRCFFCGGGEQDSYNLKMIYMHWWELDAVKKLLREAGVEVP